jgi:hypothetical protein
MLDLVERTWAELGFRVRALGYKIWVRTLPVEQRRGPLWLTAKAASFYGGLPHLRTVQAVVLSAGPAGLARGLKPGDVLAFSRGHFTRFWQLQPTQTTLAGASEEYVGVIDSNDVFGFASDVSDREQREETHVEQGINEQTVLSSFDGGC